MARRSANGRMYQVDFIVALFCGYMVLWLSTSGDATIDLPRADEYGVATLHTIAVVDYKYTDLWKIERRVGIVEDLLPEPFLGLSCPTLPAVRTLLTVFPAHGGQRFFCQNADDAPSLGVRDDTLYYRLYGKISLAEGRRFSPADPDLADDLAQLIPANSFGLFVNMDLPTGMVPMGRAYFHYPKEARPSGPVRLPDDWDPKEIVRRARLEHRDRYEQLGTEAIYFVPNPQALVAALKNANRLLIRFGTRGNSGASTKSVIEDTLHGFHAYHCRAPSADRQLPYAVDTPFADNGLSCSGTGNSLIEYSFGVAPAAAGESKIGSGSQIERMLALLCIYRRSETICFEGTADNSANWTLNLDSDYVLNLAVLTDMAETRLLQPQFLGPPIP